MVVFDTTVGIEKKKTRPFAATSPPGTVVIMKSDLSALMTPAFIGRYALD